MSFPINFYTSWGFINNLYFNLYALALQTPQHGFNKRYSVLFYTGCSKKNKTGCVIFFCLL